MGIAAEIFSRLLFTKIRSLRPFTNDDDRLHEIDEIGVQLSPRRIQPERIPFAGDLMSGEVLCGSPILGLRARREARRIALKQHEIQNRTNIKSLE
jgi:hypothetical protein